MTPCLAFICHRQMNGLRESDYPFEPPDLLQETE